VAAGEDSRSQDGPPPQEAPRGRPVEPVSSHQPGARWFKEAVRFALAEAGRRWLPAGLAASARRSHSAADSRASSTDRARRSHRSEGAPPPATDARLPERPSRGFLRCPAHRAGQLAGSSVVDHLARMRGAAQYLALGAHVIRAHARSAHTADRDRGYRTTLLDTFVAVHGQGLSFRGSEGSRSCVRGSPEPQEAALLRACDSYA
jgi:hypothetical protein